MSTRNVVTLAVFHWLHPCENRFSNVRFDTQKTNHTYDAEFVGSKSWAKHYGTWFIIPMSWGQREFWPIRIFALYETHPVTSLICSLLGLLANGNSGQFESLVLTNLWTHSLNSGQLEYPPFANIDRNYRAFRWGVRVWGRGDQCWD